MLQVMPAGNGAAFSRVTGPLGESPCRDREGHRSGPDRADLATEAPVRRRLVYHIGGFDRMGPAAFHTRFLREMRRFEATWSVAVEATEPVVTDDEACWRMTTRGPNWRAETELRLVRWDDAIDALSERPLLARLVSGAVALGDFALAGALSRYFRTNWRYALFFLYPLALLVALAAVAFLAAHFASAAFGPVGAAVLGGGVVVLVLLGLRRRLYLLHLLDDWTFSRRYVRSDEKGIQARFDRLAARMLADGMLVDEVLVVGHSLGAVLAVDYLDRALAAKRPDGAPVPRIVLLTIGSSILKIGLHRGAKRFRAAVERVAKSGLLFWVEYQAVADIMNFYKTDPVACLGIDAPGRPLVRLVRLRRMLHPAFYRRLRGNFFRMHNQFISGNDLRASYDYFMFLCGPLAAETLAHQPEGAISAIEADGTLGAA